MFSLSLFGVIILTSACSNSSIKDNASAIAGTEKENILYIYKDGKMRFRSRYLNEEDVVIYEDGRGGEKAAVKLRVPRYPDYYHDSIVVIRVDESVENSISQN